jgi:hypothetical protein
MIVTGGRLIRDASGNFGCPKCWNADGGIVRPPMMACPRCGVALEWTGEAIEAWAHFDRRRVVMPEAADPDAPETGELLTDDDRAALNAIMNAEDPLEIAQRLHAYYGDMDRAERTPRGLMYLHLGMLAGRLERLATVRPFRPFTTPSN